MNDSNNTVRVIVVVAIVLIAGGALAYALVGRKPSQTATMATTTASAAVASPTVTSTTTTTVTTTSVYKDGTYSATGSYISPGGDEKLGVNITLKNDVVTDASVTPEPVSPEGQRFQSIFAANFKQYVIGKNISSIHLTKVSGSSLTPGGFDNALAQIEAQAKA